MPILKMTPKFSCIHSVLSHSICYNYYSLKSRDDLEFSLSITLGHHVWQCYVAKMKICLRNEECLNNHIPISPSINFSLSSAIIMFSEAFGFGAGAGLSGSLSVVNIERTTCEKMQSDTPTASTNILAYNSSWLTAFGEPICPGLGLTYTVGTRPIWLRVMSQTW